jgi:DNA-binding beta-propeller fold protein YncE
MNKLPLQFESFFPQKRSGANVTYVYWYETRGEDMQSNIGAGLFVSLSGPQDFMGERASKFMWDSFREEYIEGFTDPTKSLRNGMKAAQKTLVELMKNEDSVSEQGVDLHMVSFCVVGKKVYVSIVGDPEFILIRGDRIIDVKDMMPSYDGKGYRSEISVGAFELQDSDINLISTPELLTSLMNTWQDSADVDFSYLPVKRSLEQFEGDMSGNQYVWMIRYGDPDDVKEEAEEPTTATPAKEEMHDDLNESSDTSVKDDGADSDKASEIEKRDNSDKTESDQKADRPNSPIGGKDMAKRKSRFARKVESSLGVFLKKLNPVKQKIGKQIKKLKETGFAKGFNENFIKKIFKGQTNPKAIWRNIKSWFSKAKIGGGKKKRMFISKNGVSGIGGKSSKIVVVVLIVVIASLIGLLVYRSYQKKVYRAAVAAEVEELQKDLKEVQNAWNVDKNPDQAETIIAEIEAELAKVREEELTEEQQSILSNIEVEILRISDSINKITPLSENAGNIEIILDAYLEIGEEAEIMDIEKRGEYIYLTDQGNAALYRYKIGGSVAEKVANSEQVMEKPNHVSIDDGYIFVYDDKLGIVSLALDGGGEFTTMPELSKRSIAVEVTEIETFGGNLYMLDGSGGQVLKSIPAGAGFSYPSQYFGEGYLQGAVDMLIDGNVYILNNSAEKIYKFYTGRKDNFQLSGLDKPLGNLCCGYTNHYGDKPIWIFDKDNKRILTIEKGTAESHPGVGVMIDQMVYRGERNDIFNDVKEIVADTDGKNLYVLDGSRVLRVSLDHVQ